MKFALAIALLLPTSTASQFETVLNFSNGTTQVCRSTGWNYSPGVLTVQVVDCVPDEIFRNGFEP